MTFELIIFLCLWSLAIWNLFVIGARVVDAGKWSLWWLSAIVLSLVPCFAGLVLPVGEAPLLIGFATEFTNVMTGSSLPGGGNADDDLATRIDLLLTLEIIWALGAIFFLGRLGRSYRHLRQIAAEANTIRNGPVQSEIKISGSSKAAYALGFFNPVIILPQSMLEEEKEAVIELVIAHESEHLYRRDPEVSLLLSIICSLFWCLPWVCDLASRWRLASEINADQAALEETSLVTRNAYASTLLTAMRSTRSRDAFQSSTFGSVASRDARERLKAISSFKEKYVINTSTRLAFIAFTLCLVLIGTLASGTLHAAQTKVTTFFEGTITSPFGYVDNAGNVHGGIDLAAPRGTDLHSPIEGKVLTATNLYKNQPSWGKVIVIQSADNISTLFAHLEDYHVSAGQDVAVGDVIATVGTSGAAEKSHVHIETHQYGKRVDPGTVYPQLTN